MRWVRVLVAACLVVAMAGCTDDGPGDGPDDEPAGPRDHVLRMSQPRAVHRATLLADGRVLITGGCTEKGCGGFDAGRRAELYDGTRGLMPGTQMTSARASGTATLLDDGRVLLVGGYPGEGRPPTGSVEVYDPGLGLFRSVGELETARADHSATLLPDGRVLVAGGFDQDGTALATTEVFDPTNDVFAAGPQMLAPRADHVAVLSGPDVVLLGGTQDQEALSATEVLDAGSQRWVAGPDLAVPRVKLGAIALGSGRVLVVGGATDTEGRSKLRSTELVDLRAHTVTAGPELDEGEYKLDGAISTLGDGRIVVGGGAALEVFSADGSVVRTVRVPGFDARSFRTLTTVGPETVLVLGGYDDGIVPTDAAYLVQIPA